MPSTTSRRAPISAISGDPANISGRAPETSATARRLPSPTICTGTRFSMRWAFPIRPTTGVFKDTGGPPSVTRSVRAVDGDEAELGDVPVPFGIAEPALLGGGQHLGEADRLRRRFGGDAAGMAAEHARERRALGVEVHRLALGRRFREQAPRQAATACERRDIARIGGEVARRDAPALPAEDEPPGGEPGSVVGVGEELERAHAGDEDGDAQCVEQGDAELAAAIDEVVAVHEELVDEPGAPRGRGACVGHDRDVDVVFRADRHAARLDADPGRVGREQQGDPPTDGRPDLCVHRVDVRVAVGEEALEKRVRAGMDVADDGQIVAGVDGSRVAGGDLEVDGLERGGAPGGLVVGEGRDGPCRQGAQVGVGKERADPLLELGVDVIQLLWQLHERLHHAPEHRPERAAAAGRQGLVDHGPADRVHAAAVPAARLEQGLERRRDVADERRSQRHLEVAHAVDVGQRAGAVRPAVVSDGLATRQVDEGGVEAGEAFAQVLWGRYRECIRGGFEPADRLESAPADGGGGVCLERVAQVALGAGADRDPERGVDRRGERLDPPRLEVNRALALERARANLEPRPAVCDLPPGERAEEADRVVLGAVALPVAGDDLVPLARLARLHRAPDGDLGDSVLEGGRVLPRHRLPKERILGDSAQAGVLVPRTERLETRHGEPRAANGEVAPERPVSGQGHEAVGCSSRIVARRCRRQRISRHGCWGRRHRRLPRSHRVRIAWSPQAGAATGATLDFDPTVSTTPPNAQGLEARLLQRDHEVARIRAGLDSACAGAGVAVVVEGEAGIGKTALLALASAMAQERGMRVLAARASELETDYPFGVVRQCLEPNLHAADAATREELLAGAAALAGPVVLDWRGDAGAESLGVLHGLYWLVANLAQRQPLLLAIDDLHWADEPSQRFVAYLLPRIDSLPVALALATRPAGASAHAEAVLAEVLAAGGPDALAPAPLDESAAAQLLRDVAGGPGYHRLPRPPRPASRGKPFLLSGLVRALRAEGVPFTARGAERGGEITPPQVARVARARLTRLDPRAQALAHAVVVLGDDAPLELASELANVDRAVAATAADELVAAGLIDSQRLLRFRHPLLRSAVAATLTLAERERSHRVAAELLRARGAPPERVAVHLLMTAPIGESSDKAALHEAAVLAVDRGAPAAAVPLYLRLLDEPLGARERADVLLELGRAEYIAGLFGEATGHLEEAYRIAHDPSVRGAALVLLLQASLGSVEALATLADDVPRAVEALRDHDRELALRLQAYAMLMRRDGTDAEQLASFRALAGDTPGEATVLAHLVLQRVRHGASAAEIADLATRAARQVDALIEDGTSTTAFIAVTLGLRWADRLDDAERILERAIEVARQRGSTTDFANALGLRGEVYVRRGLLREAEADARTAQATQLEQGW